jgi:hypothetical protein
MKYSKAKAPSGQVKAMAFRPSWAGISIYFTAWACMVFRDVEVPVVFSDVYMSEP